MMNGSVSDIGRIVIQNGEGSWILPTFYINNPNIYSIQSPLFTHLRKKWRLALRPHGTTDMHFWLWKEEFPYDPPCCRYAVHVQFKLETRDGRRIGFCEGELTDNYGFEALNFCFRRVVNPDVKHSGRIKIFFTIRKKNDVGDVVSPGTVEANSSRDEASSEDKVSSEDEFSSEGEIISDEEDTENRKVSSKMKGIEILSENLKQAFLDGRMSDAVLKVEDREFKVHKFILVARSPVFASMFEQDLTVNKSNYVDIPDCTAESFEVFLHYLYCGNIETLSTSNVYNVYYAADKYRVDDLKRKCLKFMISNISVETFCDVIPLALLHGESKLQKRAVDFFCQNIKEIIKTVQWQKYLSENPIQANEIFIKAHDA